MTVRTGGTADPKTSGDRGPADATCSDPAGATGAPDGAAPPSSEATPTDQGRRRAGRPAPRRGGVTSALRLRRGNHRLLHRPQGSRSLWARLGLRARVTVMFGLGALLLAASMGSISYFTTRHFLLAERQNASLHQAFTNAELVRTALVLGPAHVDQQMGTLDSGTQSESIVFDQQGWFSSRIAIGENAIPVTMRQLVLSGTAATEFIVLSGQPQIVVGVPLEGADSGSGSVTAAYFEVFYVGDLAHTLGVLAAALWVAGIVTTLLGAGVGLAASGRTIRPLTEVSAAAVAIASGRLDTRLPAAQTDPDLAGLTNSFNRMVDQLQERIERDARFTSDVSHELRSPLTTLAASLAVLEDHRAELSARAQRALDLLSDDLHRFERMVADLLEMSRSDNGSADFYPEEVAAGELVRRSVDAACRTPLGVTAPPRVVVEPNVEDVRLAVDKRRFERIIANLVENAAFYGGGATLITAREGPPDGENRPTLQVVVDDHGPGVAPSERTKVFERFYRGHAAGRRGAGTGTGLGLALVVEHARVNGGSVWVEEAPGGGARFVVQLPIQGLEDAW